MLSDHSVEHNKALMVGSFIGFLVTLVDKNDNNKTQRILKKVLKRGSRDQAKLSNDIWTNSSSDLIREFTRFSIEPTVVIETLFYSHEKILRDAFTSDLENSCLKFCELYQMEQLENTETEFAKSSYVFADKLAKETEIALWRVLKKKEQYTVREVEVK